MLETVSLIGLGGLAWLWFDSLKARDAAIRATRAACDSESLQLLDDTVAIISLWLGRNDDGRVMLRRVYAFEFSNTGDNRRSGSVTILGHHIVAINLGLRIA
jgi:hypothetical protein